MDAEGSPLASRRALVRTAVWSAPVVPVAALAPAYAIASTPDAEPRLEVSAHFYVLHEPQAWNAQYLEYEVVPMITLSNLSRTPAEGVEVRLELPVADFAGLPETGTDPPMPGLTNFGDLPAGWRGAGIPPEPGDRTVSVAFYYRVPLDPGSIATTVRSEVTDAYPTSLDFLKEPTVTAIRILVSATFAGVAVETTRFMTRIDPPTV